MTVDESLFSDVPVRASMVCLGGKHLFTGMGFQGFWNGRAVSGGEIRSAFDGYPSLKKFAKKYAISLKAAKNVLEANNIAFAELLAKQNHRGASLNQLSHLHGPKPSTISKWIRAAGYEVQHGHVGYRPDEDKIKRIYLATGSVNACVERTGVSWEKAAEILDRLAVRRK